MKQFLSLIGMLAAVAAFGPAASAAPTRQWAHGNPSADAQYALDVFNRFRKDPIAAAQHYQAMAQHDPVLQSLYGDDFVTIATQRMATLVQNSQQNGQRYATAPLAFYPMLTERAATLREATYNPDNAAGQQSNWLIFLAADAHNQGRAWLPPTSFPEPVVNSGTDSSNGIDPAYFNGSNATGGTAACNRPRALLPGIQVTHRYWQTNIYDTQYITPLEATLSCLSHGVITNYQYGMAATTNWYGGGENENLRLIGIDVGTRQANPGTGVRIMTCEITNQENFTTNDFPYGQANTCFILGVVYKDLNRNGEYDPGEGISGITVTPSTGDWYAITSSSGGYAIPVQRNSGTIQLTLSGRDFGQATIQINFAAAGTGGTATTSIGADSVKVDFALPADKPVQITVPPADGTTQFTALSTRGLAQTGENVMIGGLIITGPADGSKKTLLIRGLGIGLANAGIRGFLAKPILKVFDGSGQLIATRKTQDLMVQTIPGSNSRQVDPAIQQMSRRLGLPDLQGNGTFVGDVALIIDLAPGLYTVHIGADSDGDPNSIGYDGMPNSQSGVVLLEIYDATLNTGGRLNALSTRAPLGSGEKQLIVGFITTGTSGSHFRCVMRGLGPQLLNYGVTGAVTDTSLTLYSANGTALSTNDDWGVSTWTDQLGQLAVSAGLPALPAVSKDSAILARLDPGLYTAIVTPYGTGTVGLVEVYETP